MNYYKLHIRHGNMSAGYTIPVVADSPTQTIEAAVEKGLFQDSTDRNCIDSIICITADECMEIVKNFTHTKTIVGIEFYDGSFHAVSITCKIPHPRFDLVTAAKAAANEYCKTGAGKAVYSGNCHNFNWGDFTSYVSNAICVKHGFMVIHDTVEDEVRDFNEQLVVESDIFPEE